MLWCFCLLCFVFGLVLGCYFSGFLVCLFGWLVFGSLVCLVLSWGVAGCFRLLTASLGFFWLVVLVCGFWFRCFSSRVVCLVLFVGVGFGVCFVVFGGGGCCGRNHGE